MKWRSPRCVKRTSPCRISYSRTMPSPPRRAPAPPESRRRATRCTRIGASSSSASAGRFMQFVASVSMTSTPSLSALAPGAAGDQLARDVARAVGPRAAEGQHQQLPAAVGRHPVGHGLRERRQDGAADALDGGGARVDRSRLLRIDDGALGQVQRDRPEAAAVGGNGRVGDGAHDIAGGRQAARRHDIEGPAHLRARTRRNRRSWRRRRRSRRPRCGCACRARCRRCRGNRRRGRCLAEWRAGPHASSPPSGRAARRRWR